MFLLWKDIETPPSAVEKAAFFWRLTMAYLSEILGRPVTDLDGKSVGKLKDVVVRPWAEFPHPLIEAITIEIKNGETCYLPFAAVAALLAPVIPLKYRGEELPSFVAKEDDVLLSRDVLDKQIIDTDGARVVRVNDVELVRVNGTIYVSNVDVSWPGIIRRMGLVKLANFLNPSQQAKRNLLGRCGTHASRSIHASARSSREIARATPSRLGGNR
jgi:magnesium transporter